MDIKALIETAVKKISGSSDLLSQFKANPVKVVEKIIGKDLPDEIINKVVTGVKAKLLADDAVPTINALKDFLKR